MPVKRDPVLSAFIQARSRLANAERSLAVLAAEAGRRIAVPNDGPKHIRLQNILEQRTVERDEARRELEEIMNRPRWQLRAQLANQCEEG